MVTRRVEAPPSRCSTSDRSGWDELDAEVDHGTTTAVIRLRGSLRSGTAATLREAVESALSARPSAVVLDLTAVVADDELGLWAVPTVAGDAARCGIPLTVVAPNRKLRTRLRRLGARHVEITDVVPADR
jgi:anti-anti-sigma regulatory factor